MKHPHQLAGANVVSMDVGRRGIVRGAAGRQRLDDQIFEYAPGITGLQRANFAEIAVETGAQIRPPVVAEGQ